MTEASFSIAIVTQEEKDVWCTVCSSLLLSRLCWGSRCRAGVGSLATLRPPPDTQGEQTGHVVQGAPINLYAKKFKPLQGLGQTFSKFRSLSCSASELGTEWRHLERALCVPRDTVLTRLTCTIAFHLYYSVDHEGRGAENEAYDV